jgi:GNAT superfamily N-acetyltransferase
VSDQKIHVRPAGPGDRDQVWPLARDLATSYVVERAAFDRSFVLLLAREDAIVLVAGNPGGEVAGYLLATSHLAFHANGPVAWVEEVMVAESARGRGVGRQLMAAAEAHQHPSTHRHTSPSHPSRRSASEGSQLWPPAEYFWLRDGGHGSRSLCLRPAEGHTGRVSTALSGRPQSRRPPVVARLPSEPGVYRFRDAGGRVLYVGRATTLRSRVGSYWSDLRGRWHLTRMVAQVARIEAVACGSVHEAAWLERNLLETAMPRWNRTPGGQENWVYIRLSRQPSATPAGWAAFATRNAELAATLTRIAPLAG